MAVYLRENHQVSITRACRVVDLPKSMFYYQKTKDDSAVEQKLTQLATRHSTEGQDKYYQRIRAEGIIWNYKRIRRVYRLLGMQHRRRIKKRLPAVVKVPLSQPDHVNHTWSMDFMSDSLVTGRKFRILNVLDDFNRESLANEVKFNIPAAEVIVVLERLFKERGKPRRIRMDNGPEFRSSALQDWLRSHNIEILFIQPGRPMQNAYVERFNRSFREAVLDAYVFIDLNEVITIAEDWIYDYNNCRPHESLKQLTPAKMECLNNCGYIENSASLQHTHNAIKNIDLN